MLYGQILVRSHNQENTKALALSITMLGVGRGGWVGVGGGGAHGAGACFYNHGAVV